jgi:hypothetical protein
MQTCRCCSPTTIIAGQREYILNDINKNKYRKENTSGYKERNGKKEENKRDNRC